MISGERADGSLPRRCWRAIRATRTRIVAGGTILLGGAYLLVILYLLPAPQIISTLEAVAERVVVTVIDQRQSSFIVGQVTMSGERIGNDGSCVAGLVRPVRGATIIYSRLGNEEGIRIELLPPGSDDAAATAEFVPLNANDGETLHGALAFRHARDKCGDAGEAIARLPIHGWLRVGEEQQPPARARPVSPSLLHGGTLDVAANAISGLGMRPSVYQVTTVKLPVGSRVEVSTDQRQDPRSFWWGFVDASEDKPALSVHAATEAESLSIYRPGEARSAHIQVGALAQIFNDPNLTRIQVLVTALILIFTIMATAAEVSLSPARGEPQTVIFDIEAARRAARAGGSLDAADHSADDHSPPRG